MPHPLLLLLGVLIVVYDIFALVFLIRDHDVVHSCHASSQGVHVIWATNLWVWVLLSMFITTLAGVGAVFLPVSKAVDALRRHAKRRQKMQRRRLGDMDGDQTRPIRFGDDLPDWLFLSHGTALLFAASVFFILAFCGYFELWAAKPWCEDKKTAFEELDIWYFGRFSFFLQIVIGSILLVFGIVNWAMPFCLELTDLDASVPLNAGRGDDRGGGAGGVGGGDYDRDRGRGPRGP